MRRAVCVSGVYEHLTRLNLLLAGAKQTMSGGSGNVCVISEVLMNTGRLLIQYRATGTQSRGINLSGVLMITVS